MPFAPPAPPKYRPYTKKGLPRKRPGPAPKPKHELAKWKNKKPLRRVERSYPLERKIEVLMFLLNHRITETEPPQRAPRRRLGQPPECEASYTITETGQRLYHRAPTYAEASAWYKVPMPTIHGWWDNREKILEGTGVKLPEVPDTLPVPDWLTKPLEKDGPQYQKTNTSTSSDPTNGANSINSTASASSTTPSSPDQPSSSTAQNASSVQRAAPVPNPAPVQRAPPAQTARPVQNAPPVQQVPAQNTGPIPRPAAVQNPPPVYKPPSYRRVSTLDAPPRQVPEPVQIVFSLKGRGLPPSAAPRPFGQNLTPAGQRAAPPLVPVGPPYSMAPHHPRAGMIPPLDIPMIPWSVYPVPGAPPIGPSPGAQANSASPINPVHHVVPSNQANAPRPITMEDVLGPELFAQVRTRPIGVRHRAPKPSSTPKVSSGKGVYLLETTAPTKPTAPAPTAPAPTAPAPTTVPVEAPAVKTSTIPATSDEMEVDGQAESSSASSNDEPANSAEVTMLN
ncbi:hypothetical protein V8F33_006372 [Rhypophila sp. PSN 637]